MLITRWFHIGSVALAVAASASGVELLAWQGAPGGAKQGPAAAVKADRKDDPPADKDKPGPNRGLVVERGSVELAETTDVICELNQTTVVSILPDGAMVKKGQLVCELDSTSLKAALDEKIKSLNKLEADYQNAKLNREVAELALKEYIDGVYPSDLATVNDEIDAAESALKKANDRLDRARRAEEELTILKKEKEKEAFRTPADIVAELDLADRLDDGEVKRKKKALVRLRARLNVLETYTRDKMIKSLQVEVEKARSIEIARKTTRDVEISRENNLRTLIENCKILAPIDGVIAYTRFYDPKRPMMIPRPMDSNVTGLIPWPWKGEHVSKGLVLFSIDNVHGPMVMLARIPELSIDRVKVGQKARVKIDAFPDQSVSGVVQEIAGEVDRPTFFRTKEKRYITKVRIENGPKGVLPGMEAEVEILNEAPDAPARPNAP